MDFIEATTIGAGFTWGAMWVVLFFAFVLSLGSKKGNK